MSINVNTLAPPPTVSAQIVSASNGNLQQSFTRHIVHDGTTLGYKNHVRAFGEIYVFGNATATPIANVNTNYQFTQGVYIVNPLSINFDASGNGIRYLGESGVFFIHANLNAISGATGQQCSFFLAKNGTIFNNTKCSQSVDSTRGQNGISSGIMTLTTNDIITLWMANNSASNSITITDLSFEVFALN